MLKIRCRLNEADNVCRRQKSEKKQKKYKIAKIFTKYAKKIRVSFNQSSIHHLHYLSDSKYIFTIKLINNTFKNVG